jgi:hypothetical protein
MRFLLSGRHPNDAKQGVVNPYLVTDPAPLFANLSGHELAVVLSHAVLDSGGG